MHQAQALDSGEFLRPSLGLVVTLINMVQTGSVTHFCKTAQRHNPERA